MIIDHPFQTRGLGRAPFRVIGICEIPSPSMAESNSEAYQRALAALPKGIGVGSCAFCGMALTVNFIVQDNRGRRFCVGCDCVEKTSDVRMITAVQAAQRLRARTKAEAKRKAKRAAQQAKVEAEMAAEREKNGGLTDWEIEQQQKAEALAKHREMMTAKNQWLIDALKSYSNSGFAAAMVARLTVDDISAFSRGQRSAMAEMFAKREGRRGSKAYDAALEDFTTKTETN